MGDPASGYLRSWIQQNVSFRDHYLDLPFDLSNIFFILTANTLDSPRPLLDRAEVIRLSGYIDEEKFKLPKVFNTQKSLKKHGPGELMSRINK